MSFFSALEPLLKISPLNLMLTRTADGKITVIAIPTGVTQDSAVLKHAMKFSGTAIELDAELIERIQSIGNARLELSAMITKELELIETEKAAKARSIAKKTVSSDKSKTPAKVSNQAGNDLQEEGDDDEVGSTDGLSTGGPANPDNSGSLSDSQTANLF